MVFGITQNDSRIPVGHGEKSPLTRRFRVTQSAGRNLVTGEVPAMLLTSIFKALASSRDVLSTD